MRMLEVWVFLVGGFCIRGPASVAGERAHKLELEVEQASKERRWWLGRLSTV